VRKRWADATVVNEPTGGAYWRFNERAELAELLGLGAESLVEGKSPRLAPWLESALGVAHVRRGSLGPFREYTDLSASALFFMYCGLQRVFGATYLAVTATSGGEGDANSSSAAAAAPGQLPDKAKGGGRKSGGGAGSLFGATLDEVEEAARRVGKLLPVGGEAHRLVSALLADRLRVVERLALPLVPGASQRGRAGTVYGYVATDVDLGEGGGGPRGAAGDPSAARWRARRAHSTKVGLAQGVESVRVRQGDDVQTAVARFCRRHGVRDPAECWRLVPYVLDGIAGAADAAAGSSGSPLPNHGWDDDGGGGGGGGGLPTYQGGAGMAPLATLASPAKGAEPSGDSFPVAIRLSRPLADPVAFCCIHLNDAEPSAWCGTVDAAAQALSVEDAVEDEAGGGGGALLRGAVVIGAMGRASFERDGPHVLHLTCRRSLEELEAYVNSSAFLVPDDASFFLFTAPTPESPATSEN
jgi:hypothetical protein